MIIKVDVREKDLIELLQQKIKLIDNINLDICQLDLGDFIICDENNNDGYIIIERKSLVDLAQSIKDGRYLEQSFRLANNKIHNHNIIYLIEGNVENYNPQKTSIPLKTLYSTIFCLQYYKGFSVNRTFNKLETADFIIKIADKLFREKNKLGYYDGNVDSSSYSENIKMNKKSNITHENINEIMLSQIPGISIKTSKAILEKFKNIKNIIKHIESGGNLDDIKYVNKSNKEMKISKTCKKNIMWLLE